MIPRFDPSRFNVSLVSLRKKDLSEETLDSLGVDIEYLHRSKFDPATLPALLKIIDRKQIDVLHLHGYGATTFGRLAGAMRKLPTILHEHANLTETPWFQKVADRLLEPSTDLAIAVSKSTAEFVEHARLVRPEKVKVVYLGAPLEEFGRPRSAEELAAARAAIGAAPDDFAIGTITRLHDSKGNEFLVEAAARASSPRSRRRGSSWPARARCASRWKRRRRAGARRSLRVPRLPEGRGADAVGLRPQRVPVAVGGHAADRVRDARDGQADRGDRRRRPARHPRARRHRVDRPAARRRRRWPRAIGHAITHPDERERHGRRARGRPAGSTTSRCSSARWSGSTRCSTRCRARRAGAAS